MAAKPETNNKTSLISRIERDLLAGHFRAGEWLKQADIESQYSANRFDVRMALMDLKARQLIEHVPNKGFRVTNLTLRERIELMVTRTILETAAARMAASRITDDELARLESLCREFEENIPVAEVEHLRSINANFHNVLYEASGNQVLVEEIKALRYRGIPGMRGERLAWRTISGIRESHEDHVRMVELLKRRDGEGLAEAIEKHLGHWRQYVGTDGSPATQTGTS